MKISVAHMYDTRIDECRAKEVYVVLHDVPDLCWRAGDVIERKRVHYPYGNNCGDRRVFRTGTRIPVLNVHYEHPVTMDVYEGAYGGRVGCVLHHVEVGI